MCSMKSEILNFVCLTKCLNIQRGYFFILLHEHVKCNNVSLQPDIMPKSVTVRPAVSFVFG